MPKPDFKNDISREVAHTAFYGTSHSPERRGDYAIQEYADTLSADYDKLRKLFESENALDQFEDEFRFYHLNCRRKYTAYLSAHGRCISTLIAGPSNFPVRRAQKASASADRRFQEFNDFRQRTQKAIRKRLQPYGDGSRIQSNDPDAVVKLREKLASLEKLQETMKAGNKIVRNKKLSDTDKIEQLKALGLHERNAIEALKPDFCSRVGFPDYALQNNSAEMRRIKGRIDELLREAARDGLELKADNVRVFEDDGRVQIEFPGRPDEQTRSKLKSNGFKWSPTRGAWVRMANERARNVAGMLFDEIRGGAQA